MDIAVKTVIRNAIVPQAILNEIADRVEKLATFYTRILGCRVTVEGPGEHHRGGEHKVALQIRVPRKTLIVDHQAADDLAIAVRDAFNAADRQLEQHARLRRGA